MREIEMIALASAFCAASLTCLMFGMTTLLLPTLLPERSIASTASSPPAARSIATTSSGASSAVAALLQVRVRVSLGNPSPDPNPSPNPDPNPIPNLVAGAAGARDSRRRVRCLLGLG